MLILGARHLTRPDVASARILNSVWGFQSFVRCDDETVTFQRAWPPPGKYAPPPTVVSSGCWRPLSSPKIVASADYWPSMRTHEITSRTLLQLLQSELARASAA
jgi:hypothetical protein